MPTFEDDEAMRLAYARFPLNVKETGKGSFDDLNEANRLIWLEGFVGGYLSRTRDTNGLVEDLHLIKNIRSVTLEVIKSPETARKYLEDHGIIPKETEPGEQDNLWCDVRDIFIHRGDALQLLPHQFIIKRK